VHSWHVDFETAAPVDGSLSVWIGLENTDRDSSLILLPYSHRFGTSIEEHATRSGLGRQPVSTETIVEWSQGFEPHAEPVQLEMHNGQAMIFDGRLWHATHNLSALGTRTALLLQYTRPNRPIRMPRFDRNGYPTGSIEKPLPPCVMVHGRAADSPNRIVSPPPAGSWFRRIDLPSLQDSEHGWKTYPLFRGQTPTMAELECHVSVLGAGQSPHEPHDHVEDEIFIVLDGEAELIANAAGGKGSRDAVSRGSLALYPSNAGRHTLRAGEDGPVTSLVLKWSNAWDAAANTLAPEVLHLPALLENARPTSQPSISKVSLFSGGMPRLENLTAHMNVIRPGGGYDAHADPYDIAIVVLDGDIEVGAERLGPNSLLFVARGELHDLSNRSEAPATYIVFEFRGDARRRRVLLRKRLIRRIPTGLTNWLPLSLRLRLSRILRLQ
jgi:quercetin dioxygenase-like cupin family protein